MDFPAQDALAALLQLGCGGHVHQTVGPLPSMDLDMRSASHVALQICAMQPGGSATVQGEHRFMQKSDMPPHPSAHSASCAVLETAAQPPPVVLPLTTQADVQLATVEASVEPGTDGVALSALSEQPTELPKLGDWIRFCKGDDRIHEVVGVEERVERSNMPYFHLSGRRDPTTLHPTVGGDRWEKVPPTY